jgi:prophage regulatory protein
MQTVLNAIANPTEIYVSVKRVAQRFEASAPTIWRWTAAGTFPPPVKLSSGCTRWKLSDIEAWERDREEGKQK